MTRGRANATHVGLVLAVALIALAAGAAACVVAVLLAVDTLA
jgi:hypothetical protein